MYSVPGKTYFSGISQRTGFKTDSLEKVYRMLGIIRRIDESGELRSLLALKGGTALHGLVFGLQRLSADIDTNYIGSVERDIMQSDRQVIRERLLTLFRDLGYGTDPPVNTYAEERFDLHFTNCGGGRDHLKLEINYLDRLPLLGTLRRRMVHPFEGLDVDVLSYPSEELCAGKMRALISRGTPRDLFDVDLITKEKTIDDVLLRKATLFYLSMSDIDVRHLTLAPIEAITEKQIRDNLVPMISRSQAIDLVAMKRNVLSYAGSLITLTLDEQRYFDIFYDEKRFEPSLLFGSHINYVGLERHPSIKLRMGPPKKLEP